MFQMKKMLRNYSKTWSKFIAGLRRKFEMLRYGPNEEIKNSNFYLSANDEIIEEKEQLRDLGIIVNN